MNVADFFRIEFHGRWLVICGNHEGKAFFQVHSHFDKVAHPETGVTTDGGDALRISDAQAGNPVEHFQWSTVDIEGKKMPISQGSRELGVDVEIEIRLLLGGDFIDFISIETHEPISLVETMLSNERRRF